MADEFTKAALYWIKTFNKKVKEKIWMMKLIELLNEYEDYKEKETEIRNYTRRNVKCDGVERIECLREVDGELFWEDECTAIIICKGYMFIQWLVENDKIDISKIKCWYVYNDTEEDKVKNVIMNLSISDTPIDDLISYLK